MSTQKNEQYHILSPEWLAKNRGPDDMEFQRPEWGDDWYPSSSPKNPSGLDTIHFVYRTQRTNLPPEAYITTPTDTTGSGREGETVDRLRKRIERWPHQQGCAFYDNAPYLHPKDGPRMCTCGLDAVIKDLAELTESLAQVEALRRDGERIELLEKWAKESPTGISFDWCRYAEEGQVLEHGFRFMRRHFLGDRKPTLRAAIDSAQRQEGV